MSWNILKKAITDVIKTNGNEEITGQNLQNTLVSMVNALGDNSTFAGFALPTTNPGNPDGPVFYLANVAGVYSNFSGYEVKEGEAVVLNWDGSGNWSKHTLTTGAGGSNSVKDLGGITDNSIAFTYLANLNNLVTKTGDGAYLLDKPILYSWYTGSSANLAISLAAPSLITQFHFGYSGSIKVRYIQWSLSQGVTQQITNWTDYAVNSSRAGFMTPSMLKILEGASGVMGENAQVIEWSHNHNMNDYKEAGTYRIKGERTGNPLSDNLPIMNQGSGHTIEGILYVLDSSLTNGSGNADDCTITQFLMLSNRVGGQEGDMYMRSGYGANKDSLTWKPWEKYQTNMEVGCVSDDATHDATTLTPINSNGLKTFVDNGMYSGVYLTQEALSGDYTKAETFVMVVINNYAAAGDNKTITQIKFAVATNGTYRQEYRTLGADGSWSEWHNEMAALTIVNDLTTGGADKALSAEMGKELTSSLLGTSVPDSEYSKIQWPWRPGSVDQKGEFRTYTSGQNFMRTDYIPTKDVVSVIFTSYYVNPYISPIAFYNSSKALISAPLNNSSTLSVNGKTIVDVPEEAVYMAFTSQQSTMSKFSFNYSPFLATAIAKGEIDAIKAKYTEIEAIEKSLQLTIRNLEQAAISTQYVGGTSGALLEGGGSYGSYIYNIEGITGTLSVQSDVVNNVLIAVCRVEDANGRIINKFPIQPTNVGSSQILNIEEEDGAKTLYVSVRMSNDVTTKHSSVTVIETALHEVQQEIEKINDSIKESAFIYENTPITSYKAKLEGVYAYKYSSEIFQGQYTSSYSYFLVEVPENIGMSVTLMKTPEQSSALVLSLSSESDFIIGGAIEQVFASGHDVGNTIEIQSKNTKQYIALLGQTVNSNFTAYTSAEFVEATAIADAVKENKGDIIELDKRVDVLEGSTDKNTIICPDTLYAVVGEEFNLYYDSLIKGLDAGLLSPFGLYVDIQCPTLQNASNQVGVRRDRMWQIAGSKLTSSYVGEHPLQITVYDAMGTPIDKKNVTLTVSDSTPLSTKRNILCIGDSLTNNGPIVSTCAEHFANIGGTQPVFVGQRTTSGYKHEGYPGYTFRSFVTSGSANAYFIFDIPQETNVSVGDKYSTNSSTYTVVDIRTEGQDNLLRLRCIISGSTTPNSTGVLTKVSGSASSPSSINYSAFEAETGNPFWDAETSSINFTKYREKIGLGDNKFDAVVIMLGTNDCIGDIKESMQSSVANAKKIINAIFDDAGEYPTKIILQITPPDANTISSWQVYSDLTGSGRKIEYWTNLWNLRKLLHEEFAKEEWGGKVYLGQAALGIDRYYGYPYTEVDSSSRISVVKEIYHTNSVHPNTNGYKQLGDGYYLQLKSLLS